MKIILLNGPPRSGKDTIGEMLKSHLPLCALRKFAQPIVDFMAREFDIDMETCEKDKPHAALYGRTPREVAIAYSERLCKPLFSVRHFGYEALASISDEWSFVVFTDSGFSNEAEVLVEKYPCLQVLLYRPGYNFQGDSRSYWAHPKIGHIEFHNTFNNLTELRDAVGSDLAPAVLEWAKSS